MFILQAYKGWNDFWRYIVVVLFVILAYTIGQIPITAATLAAANDSDDSQGALFEFQSSLDFTKLGLDPNLVFFLLLLMFISGMLALYIGVTRIHKRSFLSIWTVRKSFDWSRFFWAFVIWLSFNIVIEGIGYLQNPGNYIWQFDLIPFLILFLIVIFILPIQTSFEEVFLRGYLLQGIGILFRSRVGALIITSIVFGAMHMMNPEVGEFGWITMITYYVSIAIFLGALALLDNGLELAIGVHTATNLFGSLFVTFDSSAIQTPALFSMIDVDPTAMTTYSFVACFLFLFLADKKYNLDWSKLFGGFIPLTWLKLIDQKRTSISQVEIIEVQIEDKFYLRTDSLIQPANMFTSKELLDFELSMPVFDERAQPPSFVADYNSEKRHEVMSKVLEYASTELVQRSDKVQMALDDGSTAYAILRKKQNTTLTQKFDNLWDFSLMHIIPVTREYYLQFNKNLENQIDELL